MNETGMQIFNNEEFGKIRFVDVNGKMYAIANDVAKALEYVRPYEAVSAHCKGTLSYRVLTSGGKQEMKVITEGDIYRLIVKAADQSRNPEIKKKAAKFESWIFDEVLPSLRRGNTPRTFPEALRAYADELERTETLKLQVAQQSQIIEEMQPKASYYDLILQSKDAVPITFIAKDYGMSATELNKLLHRLEVQYKMDGVWLLYKQHSKNGYTKSKTHLLDNGKTVMNTQWTQKGRLFIYDLLKQEGTLPVMEQQTELFD